MLMGVVLAFHANAKEGLSLFIGEWFTLESFMGVDVVFGGMASLRIPARLEYFEELQLE